MSNPNERLAELKARWKALVKSKMTAGGDAATAANLAAKADPALREALVSSANAGQV